MTAIIEAWNVQAELRNCQKLTQTRKQQLGARLRDKWWADNYAAAIVLAGKSAFCRGKNDRGWKADIDWFLRPDTAIKLLEGKYTDDPKDSVEPQPPRWKLERELREIEEKMRDSQSPITIGGEAEAKRQAAHKTLCARRKQLIDSLNSVDS